MNILGVRYGHDAAAALVVNGEIVADVAEERFTRVKNDASFPLNSIEYCLREGNITSGQIDCLAIPGKDVPATFHSFFVIPDKAICQPTQKSMRQILRERICGRGDDAGSRPVLPLYQKPFELSDRCQIHLSGHHRAHAASAYYTSGLGDEGALAVTMDGRGDSTSVALWRAEKNELELLKKYGGEASFGWFYANATEALGWRHGSDEWKLMGLAPYGKPAVGTLNDYHPVFQNGVLIRGHDYGEFGRWYDHGANHYHGRDASELAEIVKRMGPEAFCAEVQRTVEEQVMELVLPWLAKIGAKHLVCAGGVFLNVKMNQRIWETGVLDTQWIYPNPGDAGLAVGAALDYWFMQHPDHKQQRLQHLYLGPSFGNDEIATILEDRGIEHEYVDDPTTTAAEYLARNRVIGWFQGRMESGPRALGNRSILMSPIDPKNKDIINAKVKYREWFRPFCPSILADSYFDYLENSREDHFMISSCNVRPGIEKRVPAVVHIDGTARPQLVREKINPRYYKLIKRFGDITGEYVLINTSFNIKGEPIVCTPREAIRCFFDTGLDALVMGNYILKKPALMSG